jgi:hypothetical protein
VLGKYGVSYVIVWYIELSLRFEELIVVMLYSVDVF